MQVPGNSTPHSILLASDLEASIRETAEMEGLESACSLELSLLTVLPAVQSNNITPDPMGDPTRFFQDNSDPTAV